MSSPIPWEVLARLQSQSNPRTTHPRSWGREEAFERVLEDLLNHRIPAQAEEIERRFDHLRANRATKHRRRAGLLRGWGLRQRHNAPNPSDRLITQDLVEHVRRAVPAVDYGYLVALAEGRSYAELAARSSVNEGTLKSRVARAREQARKAILDL